MATKYVDLASGNDSTGDGTAALPYKTIAKGVTEAGSGGEVRVAGQAVVSIGNAVWTYGSTSVTVTGSDVTAIAAAGSYIRPKPAALALCPMYRVESSSYADGVTTITLSVTFRGASGTYASQRIPMVTLTAEETIGGGGRTVNFGWNLSTETQPVDGDGDPSYVTGILNSTAKAVYSTASNVICADGRLFITGDGGAQQVGFHGDTARARVTGVLDVYGAQVRVDRNHELDTVLQATASEYGLCIVQPTGISIGTLVLHNGALDKARLGVWYGSNITVGSLVLRGCNSGVYVREGALTIGRVDCEDATISTRKILEASYAMLHVGELLTSQTLPMSENVWIGAPMGKWVRRGYSGVVDRVLGRGGTGYGLRFDTTHAYQPCEVKISRPVASGKSVQLKFFAVYTGTISDPPPCYVELVEPNGLAVARYDFTPVRSAEAALEDIWDDATQQTITFSGTTARDGMLTVAIRARDNAAGDAILYVDDITWTVA